jgi:hypothetical protein
VAKRKSQAGDADFYIYMAYQSCDTGGFIFAIRVTKDVVLFI